MRDSNDVFDFGYVDPKDAAFMFLCPYYQGYGGCHGSCHEEPSCHVDAPEGGWEAHLPEDFDRPLAEWLSAERRWRKAHEDWLAAEKRWLTRLTIEPMTETGIYPANSASPQYEQGYHFVGYRKSDGGSATHYCKTYEEGEQWLVEQQAFTDRFWDEKVAWRENGSKAHGQPALVIGATHYVPSYLGLRPNDRGPKGFGGSVLRWRMIDDGPDGKVYETDSMYYQGEVPDSHRDRLPDNAVWVDKDGKART